MTDTAAQLLVDDDWKSQAQAEKQKLAEREAEKARAQQGPLPGSFEALVKQLKTQAMMSIAAAIDPRYAQHGMPADMGAVKRTIDTLEMLENKTKNNLTQEESVLIAATLWELRDSFIRVAWASRSTAVA